MTEENPIFDWQEILDDGPPRRQDLLVIQSVTGEVPEVTDKDHTRFMETLRRLCYTLIPQGIDRLGNVKRMSVINVAFTYIRRTSNAFANRPDHVYRCHGSAGQLSISMTDISW